MATAELEKLRQHTTAIFEEFESAMQYHEAWRPAAFDRDLLGRLRHSFAAHTFVAVRSALRRETILALMRVWDSTRSKNIKVSVIAEAICRNETIATLAKSRKVASVDEALASAVAESLRQLADQAIHLIEKYTKGGSHYGVREKLWKLRCEYLAHRQAERPTTPEGTGITDEQVEDLYLDTAELVRVLLSLVKATAYDPLESAKLFKHNAECFWGEVRGEKIEQGS